VNGKLQLYTFFVYDCGCKDKKIAYFCMKSWANVVLFENKFGLYHKLIYLCSVNYFLIENYGNKIYGTGQLGGHQRND
jgi:hypothetical protein